MTRPASRSASPSVRARSPHRVTSSSDSRLFSELVASLAAPFDSAHPDSLPVFGTDERDGRDTAHSSATLDGVAAAPPGSPSKRSVRSASLLAVPTTSRAANATAPDEGARSSPQTDNGAGSELVLEKYTLYETKTKLYVIASNQADSRYRVLKIDRTVVPPSSAKSNAKPEAEDEAYPGLGITEDSTIYSKDEIHRLLETLSAGNAGGITRVETLFYGIAGFVRFTGTYYMVLVKARIPVGLLGGHYIYHCEETALRPINTQASTKSAEEARLLAHFHGVDLSKNFYFSYTYNLTRTLQYNMTKFAPSASATRIDDKWMWNRHLLKPAFRSLRQDSPWLLPLVYGFVDQAKLSIFGRSIYITLIARRSRHFAGARFLKRGINAQGWVANDVETEQIVSEALVTPFHLPAQADGVRKANPCFTSFVQVRGSIPLYWSQESLNMSPKPPIELTIVDPYFSAAAIHFDDLLSRYGAPITVLNLIKQKERTPRESKLLAEFKECIDYLNQFLPEQSKIEYIAWDIAAAHKQRDQDVIGVLEDIAEEAMANNGFFHSGPEPVLFEQQSAADYRDHPLLQSGVVRTNCIDCLDRTNAAQFIIAKAALGHQLRALGVIQDPRLSFDCDAVNLITEMFHDHGDTIALQYGGSHLVNTMETYRKLAQWTSHSRDLIENLKRYYSNSFIDAEKQTAIDLFLGVESASPFPTLKDMTTRTRSYRDWYTPEYLDAVRRYEQQDEQVLHVDDTNYWQAYYRPRLFTEMSRHFAFKVNSSSKYISSSSGHGRIQRQSPFVSRTLATAASPSVRPGTLNTSASARRWLSTRRSRVSLDNRLAEIDSGDGQMASVTAPADRQKQAAMTTTTTTTRQTPLELLIDSLLEPNVPDDERNEYESYVAQFDRLSLSHSVSDKDATLYRASAAVAKDPLPRLFINDASRKLYEDMCSVVARPVAQ